jgi:hypothetical protein
MVLFYQFYFILYQYFYNRAKYINNTIKFSPQGSASTVFALIFFGWILLLYEIVIQIFKLQSINTKYGEYIVIAVSLTIGLIVKNHFDSNDRYLTINNRFLNSQINKKKIIFLAVIFFLTPYILLGFLNLIDWL